MAPAKFELVCYLKKEEEKDKRRHKVGGGAGGIERLGVNVPQNTAYMYETLK